MDIEDDLSDQPPVNQVKDEDDKFKAPVLSRKEFESERNLPYIPDPLTSDPLPSGVFFIEVIKNGSVIQRKEIDKPRITFGRSRDADFPMDHPSLSRYHACLLWNPKDGPDGCFFLIDLNSVHGTMLNKSKIPGFKPIKLNPGNDIIKLGASSRLFILINTKQTEEEVEDEEQKPKVIEKPVEKEETGCTWGFKDDMDDEEDEGGSGDVLTPLGKVLSLLQTGTGPGPTQNEHVYSENPHKTLQHWFDSEGYDFEYQVNYNNGLFKCSLEVPIDGQDVTIDGEASSKKKDALVNVCLRACQILDKAELLFPWQRQKDIKRKKTDSSDSEDEVMDETDQYKLKRAKKLAAKNKVQEILNFDSLNEKWKEISQELQKMKAKLATLSLSSKATANSKSESDKKQVEEETADALDEFMKDIDKKDEKSSLNVKIEQSKLRLRITDLEKEQQRVERLLKIAKPSFVLPALESVYTVKSPPKNDSFKLKTTSEKTIIEDKMELNTSPETKQDVIQKEKSPIKLEPGKIAISLTKKNLIQKPASVFTEITETPTTKGPSLREPSPPAESLTFLPPSSSSDSDKQYGLIIKKTDKPKPKPKPVQENSSYFNQETYVEWLPPKGQTGDGKTALNEIYGY